MPSFPPAILVYAARYAIGRQSYASSEVAQEVQSKASSLDLQTKATIVRDITEAFQSNRVSAVDRPAWERALSALQLRASGPADV